MKEVIKKYLMSFLKKKERVILFSSRLKYTYVCSQSQNQYIQTVICRCENVIGFNSDIMSVN